MIEVVEDSDVGRLNLELVPLQPSRSWTSVGSEESEKIFCKHGQSC